ncbi:CACTA en-spm transposon protein [Cucumis melo var. makuwa]|uniref:CACTA en-spm transposon protein n=1 Tax=Cucumis melo var. makuwa TaxID=1194695 RepID=A0A5A7TUL3_CUCMM|nr:CACTA en-spm transposon protein [Cucumis melo var. makuwa]
METDNMFLQFEDDLDNIAGGSSSVGDNTAGSSSQQTTSTPRRRAQSRLLELERIVAINGRIPMTIAPGAEKPISPHAVRFSQVIDVCVRKTFPVRCLKWADVGREYIEVVKDDLQRLFVLDFNDQAMNSRIVRSCQPLREAASCRVAEQQQSTVVSHAPPAVEAEPTFRPTPSPKLTPARPLRVVSRARARPSHATSRTCLHHEPRLSAPQAEPIPNLQAESVPAPPAEPPSLFGSFHPIFVRTSLLGKHTCLAVRTRRVNLQHDAIDDMVTLWLDIVMTRTVMTVRRLLRWKVRVVPAWVSFGITTYLGLCGLTGRQSSMDIDMTRVTRWGPRIPIVLGVPPGHRRPDFRSYGSARCTCSGTYQRLGRGRGKDKGKLASDQKVGLLQLEQSRTNKAARQKQPYNHSSGSKSFLQRQYELAERRGQPINRVELFWETHVRAGTFVSQTPEDAHNQMLELQSQPTREGSQPLSQDEICDQVLGRRLGYSKGLGWGPKPKACRTASASSSSTSCSQSTEKEIELQAKLHEVLERIEVQDRNH